MTGGREEKGIPICEVFKMIIGVVADDTTGANDIGIMFSKNGYLTKIMTLVRAGADALIHALEAARTRYDYCVVDAENQGDLTMLASVPVVWSFWAEAPLLPRNCRSIGRLTRFATHLARRSSAMTTECLWSRAA